MARLGKVYEHRRSTSRGQCSGDLAGDVTGFADAHADDLALSAIKQLNGLGEGRPEAFRQPIQRLGLGREHPSPHLDGIELRRTEPFDSAVHMCPNTPRLDRACVLPRWDRLRGESIGRLRLVSNGTSALLTRLVQKPRSHAMSAKHVADPREMAKPGDGR